MHTIGNLFPQVNYYANLHPLLADAAVAYQNKSLPQVRLHTPLEKAIKPDCDFDRQITKVDLTEIILKPNNSLEICRKENWNFPEIKFTVREIREYLEEKLKLDGWIIGGAANPACLPYNDIDLAFFAPYANLAYIDGLILSFIREKMIAKRASHTGYFPINMDWVLYKIYYSGRSIFKNHAGAFYGLQDLQIKIVDSPSFYCVSPADGAQVSPKHRKLRFATGIGFAENETNFNKALRQCFNKDYDVLHVEGHRDLLFRLIFKKTTGHNVERGLFNAAIQQLQPQLKQEHHEKTLGRRQFSVLTSPQARLPGVENPNALRDILAAKLKNHQRNHYQGPLGKFIDFLNFVEVLPADLQAQFAQVWLDQAESLGMQKFSGFAQLIIKCPQITPHLLAFMRGVLLCEWAHQAEGQNGKLFAYERQLPAYKDVVADGFQNAEREAKLMQEHGLQIALKENGHNYFLSLPHPGSPGQIARGLLDCLEPFQKLVEQHVPGAGLEIFKDMFVHAGFNTEYLIKDAVSYIAKRLSTVFDAQHVKKVLTEQFKSHDDHLLVLELLKARLKDPADQRQLSLKMALGGINRCLKFAQEGKHQALITCCTLIIKYADKASATPSKSDVEKLSSLPEQILANEMLHVSGINKLFKSNLGLLIPSIFQAILSSRDAEVIYAAGSFYESALRMGLLTAEQEQSFLIELLKASQQEPALQERFKEWACRLSINAMEKGVLTDKQAFMAALRRLIKTNNPRYLLYVHRYLNTLLASHTYKKDELFPFLKDLLDASVKSDYFQLDKQCFTTMLKLNANHHSLFFSFIEENHWKLTEIITLASWLSQKGERDEEIFTALGLIISASKHPSAVNHIARAFEVQMQHKPLSMSLEQLEGCARTVLWLLKKSYKADRPTLTNWLNLIVLRLLGASDKNGDASQYRELGKELLGALIAADPSKEWLKTVMQSLLLRMASAVSRQRDVISAQNRLESFAGAFADILTISNEAHSPLIGCLQAMTKGDFVAEQSHRAQMLLKMACNFDAELITRDQFKKLDAHFGKAQAATSVAAPKEIVLDDILTALDELLAMATARRTFSAIKVNAFSKFILNESHKVAEKKENHAKMASSFNVTVKAMAASSNISAVRLAKQLFDHAMTLKMFDLGQQGEIILELLKGHVTVEILKPDRDFSKDLKQFYSYLLNNHPMTESTLGVDGCAAMVSVAEKLKNGSEEDLKQVVQLVNGLLHSPWSLPGLRIKIVKLTCNLVQKLLASNEKEQCLAALTLFTDLAKSPMYQIENMPEIEAAFLQLTQNALILKNESCDKQLSTLLQASENELFGWLSREGQTKVLKALLSTGRKQIQDWLLMLNPGWDKEGIDQSDAYTNFLYNLRTLCENEEETFLLQAEDFLARHRDRACQILKPYQLDHFVHECWISIVTQLNDCEKLFEVLLLFIQEKRLHHEMVVCHIFRGFTKTTFKVENQETFRVFILAMDTVSKISLHPENIDLIMNGYIQLAKNILSLPYFDLMIVCTRSLAITFERACKEIKNFNEKYYLNQIFQLCYKEDKQVCVNSLVGLYLNFRLRATSESGNLIGRKTEIMLNIKQQALLDFKLPAVTRAMVQQDRSHYDHLLVNINEWIRLFIEILPFYTACCPEKGRAAIKHIFETILDLPFILDKEKLFKLLKFSVEHDLYGLTNDGIATVRSHSHDHHYHHHHKITQEEDHKLKSEYFSLFMVLFEKYLRDVRQYSMPDVHKYLFQAGDVILQGKVSKYHVRELFSSLGWLVLNQLCQMMAKGDDSKLTEILNGIYAQIEQIQKLNDPEMMQIALLQVIMITGFGAMYPLILKNMVIAEKKMRGNTNSLLKDVSQDSVKVLLASIKLCAGADDFLKQLVDYPTLFQHGKTLLDHLSNQQELDCALSEKTTCAVAKICLDFFERNLDYAFKAKTPLSHLSFICKYMTNSFEATLPPEKCKLEKARLSSILKRYKSIALIPDSEAVRDEFFSPSTDKEPPKKAKKKSKAASKPAPAPASATPAESKQPAGKKKKGKKR